MTKNGLLEKIGGRAGDLLIRSNLGFTQLYGTVLRCKRLPGMRKGPETGGRITVLVVDDEPLVRMDTAEILQRAGFEVEEAGNADEALRKLNGGCRRLGALVTDIQMPGAMNGCGLANRVHELFPDAAIVLISGLTRPAPEEMPSSATFLAKPASPERLLRTIRRGWKP